MRILGDRKNEDASPGKEKASSDVSQRLNDLSSKEVADDGS